MNKSYSLPLLNRPFPSLVHYPWASTCQPRMSFILYGNLVPHCCFALLAIILFCWSFSKIVYVSFMGLLGQYTVPALTVKGTHPASFAKRLQVYVHYVSAPTTKGILITLPPLPHITMDSNTTCWGDKHIVELL